MTLCAVYSSTTPPGDRPARVDFGRSWWNPQVDDVFVLPCSARRIGAGLFWTAVATLGSAGSGRDAVELVLRGGSAAELGMTGVVFAIALPLYAWCARAVSIHLGMEQAAIAPVPGSGSPQQPRTEKCRDHAPDGPGRRSMAGWIAKAVSSAAYWLFVGYVLMGLFMGDPVDGAGGTSAWPARLLAAGAVILWAAISWAWDRAAGL